MMTAPSSSKSTSITARQQDQLRRLLHPSLSNTDSLPLLLPLPKEIQREEAWRQVDYHVQLILSQILRNAVLPWYSKLTNDRQLVEEVTDVVRYGIKSAFDSMLRKTKTGDGSSSSITRLESFLLYDVINILHLHCVEVRRAIAISTTSTLESEAPAIFQASNFHPALSLDANQCLRIDEAYIDLLLLSILHGLIPNSHFQAHNEILIIMDVIKGVVRGQIRNRGNGAWVFVRLMLEGIELYKFSYAPSNEDPAAITATIAPTNSEKWHDSANLLLGLNFVYAVLKTFFLYLGVVYLDLFTPSAEPKRRAKRRKAESEIPDRPSNNQWDIIPLLELMVEALDWRQRILTRFLEQWIQIGLAWGGNRLVERQVKQALRHQSRPENLIELLNRIYEIVLSLPDQPPPTPAQEPDITIQRAEYELLIGKILDLAQQSTLLALLLGQDKASQHHTIRQALSPFLEPPFDPARATVAQLANAKSMLTLLERFAVLVNPTLET
jgi:hypothetical protein